MMCKFIKVKDGLCKCERCENVLHSNSPGRCHAICNAVCKYLGAPVEREGVAVKVKCGCNGKLKDQNHPSYRCTVHRAALPTLRLNETQRSGWEDREESKIYHACDGCKEYEPCLT